MKLSPKFISAFVAIFFALLLVACSNSSEESLADGKNVYRASYYQLELPEGFSVDSFESNSKWNVRYVKDSISLFNGAASVLRNS